MASKCSWEATRWILAVIVVAVGIIAMPRLQYIGDPLAIRAAAVNLINTGRPDVPEAVAQSSGERGQYYYQNPRNGRYYSKYGPLNTAAYLPVLLAEKALYGALPLYDDTERRTLLLNTQNILGALLLALVLLEISRLYCTRPLLGLLWVLSSMYASFGWNYLRAQTAELLQWILASVFIWSVLSMWRQAGRAWTVYLAQLSLVLLILAKGVYALWGPVFVGTAVAIGWGYCDGQGRDKRWWGRAFAPLLLGAAAVLLINYYKFGDMLASGYTQWERERYFFSGYLPDGLWGYLASIDKSIFLYQPLLLAAVWAWPSFWKRWRAEAILVLSSFVLLWCFNSCTINWGGHWSYGPRYLLAILTPLSLPALLVFECLCAARKTWQSWLGGIAVAGVLLFSLWMQCQVNSLEYFTYYRAEALLQSCQAPRALDELHKLPFGVLNYQLHRFADADRLPPFAQIAAQEVSPDVSASLQTQLLRLMRSNWYWWQ